MPFYSAFLLLFFFFLGRVFPKEPLNSFPLFVLLSPLPITTSLPHLFSWQSLDVYLSLDDFMGRPVAVHLEPGEILFASRAFQIPIRMIFGNALLIAFNQSPPSGLPVAIKKRLAFCTVDGNGPKILFFRSWHACEDFKPPTLKCIFRGSRSHENEN